MDPLPPVNKVYSTLHQEEKQHLLHSLSFPSESVAMMAPRHLSHPFDNKGWGRGCPKCDYCDGDGHWRTHCYKLNGYPSNRPQPRGTLDRISGSSKAANNVIGSSTPTGSSKTENIVTGSSTSIEIAIPGLTSDQYNRLLGYHPWTPTLPTLLVILSPVTLFVFLTENGLLIQEPHIIWLSVFHPLITLNFLINHVLFHFQMVTSYLSLILAHCVFLQQFLFLMFYTYHHLNSIYCPSTNSLVLSTVLLFFFWLLCFSGPINEEAD